MQQPEDLTRVARVNGSNLFNLNFRLYLLCDRPVTVQNVNTSPIYI